MKNDILLMGLLLFLVACTAEKTIIQKVKIGENTFNVEIANTPEKKMKGLMFRSSLDNDRGMIFPFEEEAEKRFWMKDTLIPLDMVFINKEKVIVNITTATPCKEMPCMNYESGAPAMYVLEINAGETAKRNIKIGDKIEII